MFHYTTIPTHLAISTNNTCSVNLDRVDIFYAFSPSRSPFLPTSFSLGKFDKATLIMSNYTYRR